ncbi:hypothetical protein [Pararhodobacter marinus]|uniref:hypothetical protein n=1 Tax=Pararhodobacter marinus TaxID=2184063 RepID=UPI00143DFA1D|nr:hypothetical protein [Pararhodobacter marinus]
MTIRQDAAAARKLLLRRNKSCSSQERVGIFLETRREIPDKNTQDKHRESAQQ